MQTIDNPFVRFKNVQKSYYGETLVVKNLNLDIAAGEFVTMLGPSGSGKTTCLMMLAGFETATHGDIELGGRPINNIPPHKRGIGMVFQNYALFPHMTVGENLAFPLKVRKMAIGKVEEKVRKALDMVQMVAFIDRKPAQLSGGQQQRIALARALVFELSMKANLQLFFPHSFTQTDKDIFLRELAWDKTHSFIAVPDHTWCIKIRR